MDAYAKKIEQQRKRFYKAAKRTARTMLHSYTSDFMAIANKATTTNELIVLSEKPLSKTEVEKGLKRIYQDTLPFFANQTIKQLVTKKDGNPNEDFWLNHIDTFVKTRLGEKINRIDQTTQDLFRRVTKSVCSTGIAEGWGIEKITSDIQGQLLISERYRAERIARTEVVGASNEGSVAGARATGLDLIKEWIAYKDNKTRASHLADIKDVAFNQKFKVGTHLLEYPGDPNGPAHEVINCRCTIGYKATDDIPTTGRGIPRKPRMPKPKPNPIQPVVETVTQTVEETGWFVPAKTIKEAEEFAIKYGLSKIVNYAKLSVNQANEINKTIGGIMRDFKLNTLDEIGGGASGYGRANGKYLKINKTKLNEKNYKTIFERDVINYKSRNEKRLEYFIANNQYRAIAQTKNALKYDRWFVMTNEQNTLKSIVTHEMGHVLDDQLLGGINRRYILDRYVLRVNENRIIELTDKAKDIKKEWSNVYRTLTESERITISAYSNTKSVEMFAESFSMYMQEPNKLPIQLKTFFDKLKVYANE